MCTIVMVYRSHPESPLVVAANRDEFYSRASEGPQVLSLTPKVLGGKDLARKGTWLGATPSGFFAGLTNQRTFRPSDRTKHSRGGVVLEALKLAHPDSVKTYLQSLDHASYNPFNLCFGDETSLHVAYVRPEGCELHALPPGIHVLANDRLHSQAFPKIQRAHELLHDLSALPWSEALPKLYAMLSDHVLPDSSRVPKGPRGGLMPHALLRRLQSLCIHTPLYGTVSSTVLRLGGPLGRQSSSYLYSDGAPCTRPFQDLTSLLYP